MGVPSYTPELAGSISKFTAMDLAYKRMLDTAVDGVGYVEAKREFEEASGRPFGQPCHSAEPEPVSAVSALAGECQAQGCGS